MSYVLTAPTSHKERLPTTTWSQSAEDGALSQASSG